MSEQDQVIEILNRAWNVRHNSLAAYILSAEPYVPADKAFLLEKVREVAEEDKELEGRIALALSKLQSTTRARPYEPYVSELNYLSIEYLTKVLREKLQQESIRLQAERSLVKGNAVAEDALETILTSTQGQLDTLG